MTVLKTRNPEEAIRRCIPTPGKEDVFFLLLGNKLESSISKSEMVTQIQTSPPPKAVQKIANSSSRAMPQQISLLVGPEIKHPFSYPLFFFFFSVFTLLLFFPSVSKPPIWTTKTMNSISHDNPDQKRT